MVAEPRAAHFDCTAGVAGAMLLGALLDAGADLAAVRDAVGSLGMPGPDVTIEQTRRCGLRCARAVVTLPTGGPPGHQPAGGLPEVLVTIGAARLGSAAARMATDTFQLLADAEGAVHGIPAGVVHFHKVAATDALVDVVGTAVAAEQLGLRDDGAMVTCSALTASSGTGNSLGQGPAPRPIEPRPAVVNALFRHSTTLGVRWASWQRSTLPRTTVPVPVGPPEAEQEIGQGRRRTGKRTDRQARARRRAAGRPNTRPAGAPGVRSCSVGVSPRSTGCRRLGKDHMSTDDELAGSHVLLIGATGFLGQATLERLLSSYPDTRVSLLIRARAGRCAADRLTALLRKNVFRLLGECLGEGGLAQVVRERVTVIEGDPSSATLPADLDVVIHSASTVSFDPPFDEAFRTNVSGVATLYDALAGAGGPCGRGTGLSVPVRCSGKRWCTRTNSTPKPASTPSPWTGADRDEAAAWPPSWSTTAGVCCSARREAAWWTAGSARSS
jgi:hypothetical protein